MFVRVRRTLWRICVGGSYEWRLDCDAVHRLLRTMAPHVRRTARGMLTCEDDAEDVAQVILSRLWASGRWKDLASPEAYLRQAARFEALKVARRKVFTVTLTLSLIGIPGGMAAPEGLRAECLPYEACLARDNWICCDDSSDCDSYSFDKCNTIMQRAGSAGRLTIALCGAVVAHAGLETEARAQSRWQLSPQPTLEIGSTEGLSAETFHDIRGAISTREGAIVVADGGSSELRVFSSSGGFLRAFGRLGDGPREFRGLGWIDICGGHAIVVFDSFRNRITKWDPDGSMLDEFFVDGVAPDRPPYEVTCGSSGEYAVIGWPNVADRPAALGPYRLDVAIAIADERGRLDRIVGEFPGPERLRTANNDRPHPFGRSTVARLGPGGLYVGTADSFAIHLVGRDGERRAFGRNLPVEPLSAEMRERWVDAFVSRAPSEQRARAKEQVLDSEWLPDAPPAYEGFWIDRLGFIWVTPYVIPDPISNAPVEWSVFDPAGTLVATVLLPRHLRPTEIGRDYVLGVSIDAMGVERVRRYALSR